MLALSILMLERKQFAKHTKALCSYLAMFQSQLFDHFLRTSLYLGPRYVSGFWNTYILWPSLFDVHLNAKVSSILLRNSTPHICFLSGPKTPFQTSQVFIQWQIKGFVSLSQSWDRDNAHRILDQRFVQKMEIISCFDFKENKE